VSVTSRPGGTRRSISSLVVAEPRDLVRHGVRLTMERAGAQVVADVATTAHALDVAWRAKPEMVILAATPPDMSGAEATRRLLALARRCLVLVLGGSSETTSETSHAYSRSCARRPAAARPSSTSKTVRRAIKPPTQT
jgi:DNA-binding NarL/FixJ family response regulator